MKQLGLGRMRLVLGSLESVDRMGHELEQVLHKERRVWVFDR